MKILILDRKVRRNIALFRHLIQRQADKPEKFFQTARKVYKGYINCKTGELRFPDLEEEKYALSDIWKPILIQLRPSEEGAFEVFSAERDESFDYSQLSKQAYGLFTKTLHILNQLSYDPKHGKNPFWVLRHVAVLDFVIAEGEEREKSLVHEAWYSIDRNRAEKFLMNSVVGTYLFRKDEFAQILEDNLNKKFSTPVTCITLTYREWDEKIVEKTLVFRQGQWQIYDNDPSLEGPSYNSIEELLQTMGDILNKPFLIEENLLD